MSNRWTIQGLINGNVFIRYTHFRSNPIRLPNGANLVACWCGMNPIQSGSNVTESDVWRSPPIKCTNPSLQISLLCS